MLIAIKTFTKVNNGSMQPDVDENYLVYLKNQKVSIVYNADFTSSIVIFEPINDTAENVIREACLEHSLPIVTPDESNAAEFPDFEKIYNGILNFKGFV